MRGAGGGQAPGGQVGARRNGLARRSIPCQSYRAAETGIAPAVLRGEDPVTLTLQGWMDSGQIPGLSVAGFDDNSLI